MSRQPKVRRPTGNLFSREKFMKQRISIILFILFLATTSTAQTQNSERQSDPIIIDPIVINASKIKMKDTEATYASEIYRRKEIIESGAKTIYDFLNQNTSVVSMPSSGNPFSQKLDLRGFGIAQGFQSIVVTVNGRRINNIDDVPQNLSSIPIQNIDRIEITKGSGSVVYGDGATGGTIQIYTRDSTDTSIAVSAGNFGRMTTTINSGFASEKFQFSAFGDAYKQDGFSDRGPDGNRDKGELLNSKVRFQYKPTKFSKLYIEKKATYLEYRYPNFLSKSTFQQNPGSNNRGAAGTPTNYTHQIENTDVIELGSTLNINENIETNFNYSFVDQTRVISHARKYNNHFYDGSIKYLNGPLTIITGAQYFDGSRRCDNCNGTDTPTTTTKENVGIYIQGQYDFSSMTFSFGARKEWIDYTFLNQGALTENQDNLSAFDIGINKSLSNRLNIFSNFNYAFQTHNLDNFFDFQGNFAGFLEPVITSTLNMGLNYLTPKSKTKLTLFGSKLRDELVFNRHVSFFGNSVSIDRSSKYGFELQNKYSFTESLSASINYAYIRAIIDRETSSANCINNCAGNDLPGVSRHNLTVGINFKPYEHSKVILTQSYRSSALADEDLNNAEDPSNSSSPSFKTPAFIKTDISYIYTYKILGERVLGASQIDLSAKVENLFERAHGTTLRNDVIYPSNFTRNFMFGIELRY